jgi:hypothetical protein
VVGIFVLEGISIEFPGIILGGLGEMTAKGVIRRQEIPFLTPYGTPYALYDEQDDGYIHALKGEEYRFGGYVDLRVEVAGPVIDVGREVSLDERY